MNLKDVIAKLPEADRGEAEKAIQEAIVAGNPIAGIDTKEKAVEFIAKNAVFEQAAMFLKTKAIELHDEKFKTETLPKLVEAEIKKRNPEKDPLLIKVEAMEAERAAEKAELKRERLTNLAIKKAGEEEIPSSWINRFIDEDEDRTAVSVSSHAKELKAWRDKAVETALKEKLGNNGQPRGGNTPPPAGKLAELQAAYTGLMGQKRFQEALKVQAEIAELGAKNG